MMVRSALSSMSKPRHPSVPCRKNSPRGAEIIVELESQFSEGRDEADPMNEPPVQTTQVQNIRTALDELAQSMDETLKGLQPVKAMV